MSRLSVIILTAVLAVGLLAPAGTAAAQGLGSQSGRGGRLGGNEATDAATRPIRLWQPATSWDGHFNQAARRVFAGALDWRWFKAQAMAESSLNPAARSPVGALGLMQLMPGTSREVATRLGLPDRPLDPRVAIMLGVAYDGQLWRFWSAPRPDLERLRLTMASYNAGPGSLLKAQRLAQAAGMEGSAWAELAAHLPQVTGHHSAETIGYVSRIERYYQALSARAVR